RNRRIVSATRLRHAFLSYNSNCNGSGTNGRRISGLRTKWRNTTSFQSANKSGSLLTDRIRCRARSLNRTDSAGAKEDLLLCAFVVITPFQKQPTDKGRQVRRR